MKSFPIRIFLIALTSLMLASCAAHKKPKCNTCPKWEDRLQRTSALYSYEEQHESGSRP